MYHSGCDQARSFFGMGRNQENSRICQRVVFFIKSFVELDEFNHKAVIGTCYSSPLLDKKFSFLIIIPQFEDNVGNNKSNWSRYSLDAMNQNINLVFLAVLDKLYWPVEQTLNILVLGIFEEISEIVYTSTFEPVLAVISCAVYYCFYFMLLQQLPTFCYLLSWYEYPIYYLIAFSLEFLFFQLVTSRCPDISVYLPLLLLLLYVSVCHLWEGFKIQL